MGGKEAQDFERKQIEEAKGSNMETYKNAMKKLEELKAIQDMLYEGESTSTAGLYKYFTMSFKVFQLQPKIKKIYDILKIISGEELSSLYIDLVNEALGKKFVFGGRAFSYGEDGFDNGVAIKNKRYNSRFMTRTRMKILKLMGSYVDETNDNWVVETSPIVFAYMVSEKILDKLIWICENETNVTDEDLEDYAYTELNAIFRSY